MTRSMILNLHDRARGRRPAQSRQFPPAAETAPDPDVKNVAEGTSKGAHEAREWITAWRQRTLESTLQKDTNVEA